MITCLDVPSITNCCKGFSLCTCKTHAYPVGVEHDLFGDERGLGSRPWSNTVLQHILTRDQCFCV